MPPLRRQKQILVRRLRSKRSRRRGGFFLVHERDIHHLWEEMHLQEVMTRLKVDCVFDVGANVGQYAQMLRRHVGYAGQIISFEPLPAAAAAARAAAASDPLWTVEELALGRAGKDNLLKVMRNTSFSSFASPLRDQEHLFGQQNTVAKSVEVNTESLDKAYSRLKDEYGFTRPFLKLDTQGWDVTVFMSGLSVSRNFVGLQSELSFESIYEGVPDYRQALDTYSQNGFHLGALVPNTAGHFPRLIEMDAIMVRSDLLSEF